MKRTLAVIFSMIIMVVVFPFNAGAAETLKAPTVQYKIVNHDKVSLKWNKIDGAESYYIYKRNDKTGKYTKIHETKSNAVTLKKLSPDMEYSYAVVAVKDGVKSKSSNKVTFTTPVEWYIERIYDEDDYQNYILRHHYDGSEDKSFKKEYDLILFKDEFYIGDWVYFIGYTYPEEYAPVADAYIKGDYTSLYRMKNDGSEIEEIFPFELFYWKAKVFCKRYGDYIVIRINQYNDYDKSGLYIYSINDNKVITVTEDFNMNIEDIHYYNDRLYFRADKLKWKEWYDKEDFWHPFSYTSTVTGSKNYSVKLDGTDLKQDNLYDDIDKEIADNFCGMVGDYYYYFDGLDMLRADLKNGHIDKIFTLGSGLYIDKVEFVGNYIYIDIGEISYNELGGEEYSDTSIFYRVKCDGTKLIKSDKPFEWKY